MLAKHKVGSSTLLTRSIFFVYTSISAEPIRGFLHLECGQSSERIERRQVAAGNQMGSKKVLNSSLNFPCSPPNNCAKSR
jgi:hypothetical protein